MGIPNLGPKFVSGSASTGWVHCYRDDGTSDNLPVLVFMGTLTDNLDGTHTLTFGGS